VKICYDARGRTADATIATSAGYEVLDDAALKMARNFTFKSGTRGVALAPGCIVAPLRFGLSP
jgi:TonB family protein